MAAPAASAGPAAARTLTAGITAWEWLALGLLLATAAWLQHPALQAPFFADDYLFLDQARSRSLAATLVAPDPIGNYFRPLSRQVWFWSLATLTPEAAPAFHAANLVLFLAAVALLWALARRMLGPGAALVAAAILALHHAADVPVMWACGSQDLLAVVGALASLLLFSMGRRGWAALAFLLALLSKETIVLTPFVAAVAGRRGDERWGAALRRAWPLFAALALWAPVWWWMRPRMPVTGPEVQIGPAGIPATLVHLIQAILGLEWPHEGPSRLFHSPPPVVLVLVIAAGVLAARKLRRRRAPEPERHREASQAFGTGIAWALLGAAPAIAVAGIWSAYYFLFAVCGAALAVAARTAASRAWIPWAVVLAIGWTAENARRLPEFATARSPWTAQSHVNRHYLERGTGLAMIYLQDLRRARPVLPPRSTLFFSGVPAQLGFQTADGPLVRWAYRDSSLRSHFLTRFRLAAAERGPVFFFQVRGAGLEEVSGPDSLERVGFGLMLSGAFEAARDAMILALRHDPGRSVMAYRIAIVELALGNPDVARAAFARAGCAPDSQPPAEVPLALQRMAAGDTTGAIALVRQGVYKHALNPGVHALLADLSLSRPEWTNVGAVEALAARLLAPGDPEVWRRWGLVAATRNRNDEARRALERYFAMAGEAASQDVVAQQWLAEVRRRLPGGDLAQEGLKKAIPAGR